MTIRKRATDSLDAYPTEEPDTVIIESIGGGESVVGPRYEQRYFSKITTRDGKAFRMREYCNPYQTWKSFGRQRWEDRTNAIMAEFNVAWPESQAPS